MYNSRLPGILRSISIIIIFIIVFFYILLNILIADIVLESGDKKPRKKYEYSTDLMGRSKPGFAYNLEYIFRRQIIPELVEIKNVVEPMLNVKIPSLDYVGMIETDEKIIYTFRNMDTNRLLLLEDGLSFEGINLQTIERSPAGIGGEEVFVLKKQGHTFQVGNE